MSMTPVEFRKYTDKEYENKMEQKDVPYEEMADFLKSHGWEQIDYENEKDEWKGMFWRRKGSEEGGMSIAPAYAQALLGNPKEENKGLIEHCKSRDIGDYSRVFLCNKCGKDIRKGEDQDGERFYWGYYGQEVNYSGGYASDPLVDTMTYRFILCESCIHNVMLTFKIPPEINTYMP